MKNPKQMANQREINIGNSVITASTIKAGYITNPRKTKDKDFLILLDDFEELLQETESNNKK